MAVMWCRDQHSGLVAHSLHDLGRPPPLSGPQFHHWYNEGWTWSLLRILRPAEAVGNGANQGSPGSCPGPKPLEASGQFFRLIKSAQRGCTAFELIHAESVMQSRRDGQLA